MALDISRGVPDFIDSVEGLTVVFTGNLWVSPQRRASAAAEAAGATVQDEVSGRVDVLVRGWSDQWRHGRYGTREERVARILRSGKYIAVVEDTAFRDLIESGRAAPTNPVVAGTPVDALLPASASFGLVAPPTDSELDRAALVARRVEQQYLRSHLLGMADLATCSLCGVTYPVELLVAAHIKPRQWCLPSEKLDYGSIVMAACALGCDSLYERGYISVDAHGRILSRQSADLPDTLAAHLDALQGRACPAHTPASAPYFAWHRRRIFRPA